MGQWGQLGKQSKAVLHIYLNALESSPQPPTRAVGCMNYSSICHKQLGNYYCHHLINSLAYDAATTQELILLSLEEMRRQCGRGYLFSSPVASHILRRLLLLSLFSTSLLHRSLSHVPPKDIDERRAATLEWDLHCQHSPLRRVTLSFAASF